MSPMVATRPATGPSTGQASTGSTPRADRWRTGTMDGMAIRGPQHARQAEDLLGKARHEKNETTKANLLAEAQVHATLALLAATVYTGSATKEQIQPWSIFGVKD